VVFGAPSAEHEFDEFTVHLQPLTDFVRELEAHLDGLRRPESEIATLAEQPVLLGDFAEGYDLRDTNLAAVAQMTVLLGEVKAALAFADEVTKVVAGHYVTADADVAAALGATPTGEG
jgi:hypothetical protein